MTATKTWTPETLYAQEKAAFARRPKAELRKVKLALGLHPWLNNPLETARLAAVTDLLKEKK